METGLIDLEIAENQIAIDFDSLNNVEEEESSLIPNSLIKAQNHDWIKDEVLFVVVKVEKHNLKLCGKEMTDWVLMAGSGCTQIVVDNCDDIVERVRNIETDKKYIAVFYSDTPLFDRASFYGIIDHFTSRSINFLQLSRGFVVKTSFLKNSPSFMQSANGGFEVKSLIRADNSKTLSLVQEILNDKILTFHISNGVVIFGANTVYIDADVEIDAGTIIHPNVVLKGETIVGASCEIESGCVVEDSIISNGCKVKALSLIKRSKVGQGKVVDAGSKVVNEEI